VVCEWRDQFTPLSKRLEFQTCSVHEEEHHHAGNESKTEPQHSLSLLASGGEWAWVVEFAASWGAVVYPVAPFLSLSTGDGARTRVVLGVYFCLLLLHAVPRAHFPARSAAGSCTLFSPNLRNEQPSQEAPVIYVPQVDC